MPKYKTHTTINLAFALPTFLILIYFSLTPSYLHLLIFSGAFIYTSLFMSPDMDLARTLKWYSLRGLLSLPFRSYSYIFKHRGLSHSLLLGSLTRIVWLSLFISLVLCLCTKLSHHHILHYLINHKKELFYALAGICSADGTHILTDKLSA